MYKKIYFPAYRRHKLILVLWGILLAFLIVEIGFRLFYDAGSPFDFGEIEEWNPMDDSQFTPRLNSLRFREEEITTIVLDDTYTRMLFLGDSFTFGQGISNGQDRFSDILEMELNERSDKLYHIYNASRPGTEPVDWLKFYADLEEIYDPNHVVAIFFLRDGTDLCTSFRCYEDVMAEIENTYTNQILYKHSAIAQFFFDRVMVQEFSDFYAEQIKNAYLGINIETWQIQQEALLQIKELCEANGSSFSLVIFPLLYKLSDNYPFYDIEAEIIRFANEAKIPVFSLTPGFIGKRAEDLWISDNDQHPNEKGHRIAAETLLPFLIEVVR